MPQIASPQPSEQVLSAFNTRMSTPEKMGSAWDYGWRIGDVVFARATDFAAWSAKLRLKLDIPGARVVRPLRSTDGRFVVGGWKANHVVTGSLSKRVDETAALALRWDAEMLTRDDSLVQRDDVFAAAEDAAWEETGEGYQALPKLPETIGHADLLASTIYSGNNPPAIVDVIPTARLRPKGYSAALVIVDGLIAGAVDDGICDRFAHVPGIDQLLLRAVAYRRQVNNLHPESKSYTRSHIERVEEHLLSRVGAIMDS
ncbi:hypothetical protein ACG98H_08405 [Corynebacterium sp. L4756]|uniref:hypothetical protein n=1 Tax=unclassified Corynebacterium TaxID=2624378 RepID=UPI00374D6F8E